MKGVVIWICTASDIEEAYGAWLSEQALAAYNLAADLARELELDPYEEVEVEHAPIDWAEAA